MTELGGKVGVVTGGASGIGRAIAVRLIAEGMSVVIADIEKSALEATAAEIGAVAIHTDVSSMARVSALADAVRERFGTVHLLCNNAGVGSIAPIDQMTLADWQWILGVNLMGTIHGVSAFLPMLRANADGGHIVNTASTSGFLPTPSLGGYTVTKYAIVAFSETLALELAAEAPAIGVTLLCPGPVRTNIKASSRNRPASLGVGALTDKDLESSPEAAQLSWLDPADVAEIMLAAVRRGDLYAFTHPDMTQLIAERHRLIAKAF